MDLLEVASKTKKSTRCIAQHTQGAQQFSQGHISTRVRRSIFFSGAHLDGCGVPVFLASFPIWSTKQNYKHKIPIIVSETLKKPIVCIVTAEYRNNLM